MNTTQNTWFIINKDETEYICTLPDTQGLAPVGAHAAHGPFVAYPFEVIRPATPDEIAWAESEIDQRIADRDADNAAMENDSN